MPSTPTLSAMITEVEREIKMRKEVYGRQVSGGKLRAAEAEYKIGLMDEVRKILVWLESIDRDGLKAYLAQRKAVVHNLPNQGSEKKFDNGVSEATTDSTA